jgi:hypothetical protein
VSRTVASVGSKPIIVTEDDRFVFLDLNPSGQYLFIEELVPSLTISDSLAALLENE